MQYTELPNTDMRVSRVAMGCWALAGDFTWGEQDEAEAVAAVHAALDTGINFFDTAEMYGDGVSEERLGKALEGRRHQAVIASKIGPGHNGPDQLRAACHRSLRLLRTDYMDLYQIHWADAAVPLADTWDALEQLREEGKLRAIGVCNFGPRDLGELLSLARPATCQLPYSLLMRAIEFEILPRCRQAGIGVLCYSPLLLGLLTGKFTTADQVPPSRARSRHFSSARPHTRHGEPGCEDATFEAIGRIREICRGLGRSMADVALAWLLHQPGVVSVLAGVRSPQQARDNVAAAQLALDADVLDELARVTEPVKQALGPNADMWQTQSESRLR